MGGRRRRGTKGSREGPLGAAEGHSRGAPIYPLQPPLPRHGPGGGGAVLGGLGELKRVDMERRWEAEGT